MKKFTLLIAALLLIPSTAFAYSDTEFHQYEEAIDYISTLEIVEGYEDGTFKPDANINRAELLKIIMESNEIAVDESLAGCFSDVTDEWFAKYVCSAERLLLIEGYEDGTFRPANNINFAEALKIVELGYGANLESSDPWYQTYLDEALNKNLTPYEIHSFDTIITRGQMADIITRQLTGEDGTLEHYLTSYPIVTDSSYTDNEDGTITDNITGLMWQKDPGAKMDYNDAVLGADSFELAGHFDWRLPTIKELYSLIDFKGVDPSGPDVTSAEGLISFIDEDVFDFEYGDPNSGDRIIDSQWTTSSKYVSTVMNNQKCFFGVNFADGRIKCYPTQAGKGYFTIYVRGNSEYGTNKFTDNGDGTITDSATNLMWQKGDSNVGMNWQEANDHCEVELTAGLDDWRLPHVKELQSIVDYTRSPETTESAAIDPLFNVSEIEDEDGYMNYPFYWSETTHLNMINDFNAAYVAFGEALGWMNGQLLDVHGAGAQRSDPKQGDASNWPQGHGPQGDVIRIDNFVKCVR